MKIPIPTFPGQNGSLPFPLTTTGSSRVEAGLAPALDTTILLILETFNSTPDS
jgi:hypothetical protein